MTRNRIIPVDRNASNCLSITEIIRRVGYKKWIDKREQKLPKTTMFIEMQLESFEDFMIRKIASAEVYYIEKKQVPNKDQIMRRASIINSTTQNSPKIQKAIDDSINRIKSATIENIYKEK